MANTTNKRGRKSPNRALHIFATIGKVLGTLLLVGVTTGAILACFTAVYIKSVILPDTYLDLQGFTMDLSSTIYYNDESGNPVELQTLHGGENRVWVKYEDIPKNLINAAVAIEDKRFFKHNGVDWRRTLNGVLTMFTGGDIQGGSTITQQLIKNLTQYDDVTVKRKILEIFRALEFDKNYSKEQILEYYLNYIYLGEGCNGVYTAAYAYFGKNVADLDLAECASLISITNNPSLYNPYLHGKVDGEANNTERRKNVLNVMCEEGYITEAERDAAKAEQLTFVRGQDESRPTTQFTWYEEQVISDVIEDLGKLGYSSKMAADLVYSGGLEIYTCLDPKVQAAVDSVYSTTESMPIISASGQQLQSSIVIVDPEGRIVALAGSLGKKEINRGLNMARDTKRQPGSAFKPLAVYAPGLEMGLITPYSVFDDSQVMTINGKAWPSNSYGYYHGRMTVMKAVEQSSNPVAVRVLQQITPEASMEFVMRNFGITTLEANKVTASGEVYSDIGLSQMALGGLTTGVTTTEMAGAYATFPRNGVYIKPHTYTKVVDSKGKVILENSSNASVSVFKESTAWYINNMLENVVTSGTGTNANFKGMTIAGKTGSTNANNDRWFVGYTPYYTAAVWTGYQQPERIKASSNPAAILWKKVMSQVHEGLEFKSFPKPELTAAAYCMDSGMAPTEQCKNDPRGSRVATGYFVSSRDIPSQPCDLHQPVEVCTDSPILSSDGTPIAGLYHLAGEFCPREAIEGSNIKSTVKTIGILDYDRNRVEGGKGTRDDSYLKSFLEAQGRCTVHISEIVIPPAEYDPNTFNISDESTWPPPDRYPNFDPLLPDTWPVATPSVSVPPTDDPFYPDEPSVIPTPPPAVVPTPSNPGPDVPAVSTPEPSPTPSPSPVPTQPGEDPTGPDDNVPYVPAA